MAGIKFDSSKVVITSLNDGSGQKTHALKIFMNKPAAAEAAGSAAGTNAAPPPPPASNGQAKPMAVDGFNNNPDPADPKLQVNMQYWGGPVLTRADVVPVYVGDYFKTSEGDLFRMNNDKALADLVKDKGYSGIWGQYGVGAGVTETSLMIPGSYKDPQYVTDADLQVMLQRGINSGQFAPKDQLKTQAGDTWESVAQQLILDGKLGVDVPEAVGILKAMNPTLANGSAGGQTLRVPGKRNDQAVYTFVLPPGEVLSTGPGGVDSSMGLGGYHSNIHDAQGHPVFYAAICSGGPDANLPMGFNGIPFSESALQNAIITESHEISEAATDPLIGDAAALGDIRRVGWYDLNSGEIGDVAVNDAPAGSSLAAAVGTIDNGTYPVQKIWSQADGTNEVAAVKGPQPLPPPATLNSGGSGSGNIFKKKDD